ncbi:MAG: 4Fe-4S binding protein [Deltaproteobacteria bacterium]|nr:4Fe-4S binding protein [Deltaproteobacteria bacterium]MBW2068411.1 4Fe-4S binding protein [Deltaproteobacteria bacterium]
MFDYTEKIREIARRLLQEKKVDGIIGFKKGTIPMMNQPVFITSPDRVELLHWDSWCGVNLANYLPKREGRIGIVAKGCDTRSIVVLSQENQVQRDQLYIIGVPCRGMLDRRKVWEVVGSTDVKGIEEGNGKVRVWGNGFDLKLERSELLQNNCVICVHRNPVVFDELVADEVEEQSVDRYGDIRNIEAMSSDEKWNLFQEIFSRCIRCYACRNACPFCYCPQCFVDESRPQWVGKTIDRTDTLTFHLLRAFHMAGRCTDCGACERACPVGIPVRLLTKKLEKDVKELYGYEAGVQLDERPPLDTYKPDDPEDFIK